VLRAVLTNPGKMGIPQGDEVAVEVPYSLARHGHHLVHPLMIQLGRLLPQMTPNHLVSWAD